MNCCWASKQPIKQLNGHPESDHFGADRLDSVSITRCQVVSAQDVRTRRLGQSGSVKEQLKQDLKGGIITRIQEGIHYFFHSWHNQKLQQP